MESVVLPPEIKYGIKGSPIKKYALNMEDVQKFSSVVIKNNTILEMEVYGNDEQQLSGIDVQLLSSAFLMAQCIKQNRGYFDATTVFEIPIEVFCELWRIDFDSKAKKDGNVYREIINSVSRLNERNFLYPDVNHSKMVESGYFSHIKYNNTLIEFAFPIPIIEYINKENDFTWYFLENILKLQDLSMNYKISKYATLLYEYIQKDKVKKKIKSKQAYVHVLEVSIEKLRLILSVEDGRWKRHIDFRTKVLDKAVEYIFERVGIKVEIQNIAKGGRTVVGYRFVVTLMERDVDFSLAMNKVRGKSIMTPLQQDKFAALLIEHSTFDSIYRLPNELDSLFFRRVKELLTIGEKLVEFEPYLRAVGYNSVKFDSYIAKLDEAVLSEIIEEREKKLGKVFELTMQKGKQVDTPNVGESNGVVSDDDQLPF